MKIYCSFLVALALSFVCHGQGVYKNSYPVPPSVDYNQQSQTRPNYQPNKGGNYYQPSQAAASAFTTNYEQAGVSPTGNYYKPNYQPTHAGPVPRNTYNQQNNAGAQPYSNSSQAVAFYASGYNEKCRNLHCQRFRTFDGTCNHPNDLGASLTILDRILPTAYGDGVNSPRQYGTDNYPLPSARDITIHVHPPVNVGGSNTIMLPAWGQFVDHDLVSVLAKETPPGPYCCGPDGEGIYRSRDPDCFAIELPQDEYAFPGKCMEFVRTVAATDSSGIPLQPRQQINEVTSFLDGSPIYGSTDEVAESVREGYLLRTKYGHFLPESTKSSCIKRSGTGDYCFHAGDSRVNQHPYLGSIHTLFLREHNLIAKQLKYLMPKASDVEIFQRTRRIVIAQVQSFTYNSWLPVILGRDVNRFSILSTRGRSYYNPRLDPRIFSSFATAGFRFGHSKIPSHIPIGNKLIQLRYLFNRPESVIYRFDEVIAGMVGLTSGYETGDQAVDRNFAEDLTRYLFLNTTTGRGGDLVSINIQRGRDHGLQPYVTFREYCGLRPVTGFNDTEALGPHVGQLARVYRHVKDIDLFTGLMHEPADEGSVGPTIRCLVGEQFLRLKFGDRFFFDNNEKGSAFSDAQLSALRNENLAKLICRNSNMEYIPSDVFKHPSESNPYVPCSKLKQESLNLKLFAQ